MSELVEVKEKIMKLKAGELSLNVVEMGAGEPGTAISTLLGRVSADVEDGHGVACRFPMHCLLSIAECYTKRYRMNPTLKGRDKP